MEKHVSFVGCEEPFEEKCSLIQKKFVFIEEWKMVRKSLNFKRTKHVFPSLHGQNGVNFVQLPHQPLPPNSTSSEKNFIQYIYVTKVRRKAWIEWLLLQVISESSQNIGDGDRSLGFVVSWFLLQCKVTSLTVYR